MKSNWTYGLIFFLFCGSLAAQTNLPTDTFVVVKGYEPTLIDANKVNFDPTIEDTQKVVQNLNYKFIQQQVPVSFGVDPIPAARIKGEPLVKLYSGYARVGIGNSVTPMAEVYYNNLRSKEHLWGFHAKHFNFNGISDIDNSGMSRNLLKAFGKKFGKKNTFSGSAGYNRLRTNYYGFAPELSEGLIDSTDTKQVYNLFHANFGMESTKRDSFNLRHRFGFDFHHLNEINDARENYVKLDASVSQFTNDVMVMADGFVSINDIQNPADTVSNILAGITPRFRKDAEAVHVTLGMGIYMDAEKTASFHFYPLAEAHFNVVENILVPYIGIKGEMQRNNFRSFSEVNPFMANNPDLINSNNRYHFYTGIRGTLSSDISFNASFSQLRTDDMALFVKDTTTTAQNQFAVVYDDVEELRLKGELSYHQREKIKLYLIGEYFGYNPDQEREVWHRPEMRITLGGTYDLQDKIIVRANLFYIGEQFAKSYRTINTAQGEVTQVVAETLDAVFDANLGFEYRYSKRLSAYLNFNNLAAVKYQRWQDYRLQGFNVMGGFTYSF